MVVLSNLEMVVLENVLPGDRRRVVLCIVSVNGVSQWCAVSA
jgi:hypothetical protein